MAQLTRLLASGVCAIFVAASIAQTPEDQPAFEAASVKRSDPKAVGRPSNDCHGGPGSSDPGQLTCTGAALAMLVSTAYDLQFYELVSPEWMIYGGSEKGYDIVAKIPRGASKEQYRLMLQKLLADRFHLAVHRESRDMSKYVLVLGKGKPDLKPSLASPPPEPPFGMATIDGHVRISTHNRPLSVFAGSLSVFLSAPVTDETGISGNYDITLEFMPDEHWRGFPYLPHPTNTAAADATPNLAVAIQQQLGLKLEVRKGPVPVLVVDRADKEPVSN